MKFFFMDFFYGRAWRAQHFFALQPADFFFDGRAWRAQYFFALETADFFLWTRLDARTFLDAGRAWRAHYYFPRTRLDARTPFLKEWARHARPKNQTKKQNIKTFVKMNLKNYFTSSKAAKPEHKLVKKKSVIDEKQWKRPVSCRKWK